MKSTLKRIGILTGGGDCPGLNAVIRSIAKPAMAQFGCAGIGILDGFEGLIEGRMRELTSSGCRRPQSKFGYMVSLCETEVVAIPVKEPILKLRIVPLDSQYIKSDRAVGSVFGD